MQTAFQQIIPYDSLKVVNVSSVAQLSPFRYPGGKTWLVPFVTRWLDSLPSRPSVLIDPFLGGGSVPLAALSQGHVDELALGEIDKEVAAVWECVFSSYSERLCKQILAFELTPDSVRKSLLSPGTTKPDQAFKTILKNRTFRGGILANGASLMKEGENGKGIGSRWYPETLAKRIRLLYLLKDAVTFQNIDAFELIDQFGTRKDAAFFIDPPYTAGRGKRAGTRLYNHYDLDHERLFFCMKKAKGNFLMTYDDDPDVLKLVDKFGFQAERVPMKNTHHEMKFELAITRNPITQ